MIETDTAVKIKERALAAVAQLDAIVSDVRGQCSDEDFQAIKRGVGLSIGKIITDLLEPVLQQHPEIDDLKA
jgi:hypothetical protein